MALMSTSDSLVNQGVARALKGLKSESGLTLNQLEELSGLSKSTLRRILRGSTDISWTSVTAMAGAMGTTPERVMARAFEDLAYDEAYKDAVERIAGRQVSDVPVNIIDMEEKRAAAHLDKNHIDGSEPLAADINDEADHDEPEAP